ncbi:hypothetical protein LMH73_019330 [Vibrio splendidus]|nr:hypothetical protein [Vibrio splendidus]MCC4883230.1 hypothetical protein [Vibrio splendidus]
MTDKQTIKITESATPTNKRSPQEVDAALTKMYGDNSSFFSIFKILYNMIMPMLKRILSLDILRSGAMNPSKELTEKEDIPTALARPYDYEGK